MARKTKPKYYVRSDGLHEAIRVINDKRIAFRGKTDAEVERKMINYKEKAEQGRTFQEVADEWWTGHRETLSVNTAYSYRPAYQRAIDEFGKDRLKEITPKDINAYLVRFSRKYKSDKVCRTQLMVISLVFKYAIINNDADVNPAANVTVPKNLQKKNVICPQTIKLIWSNKVWIVTLGYLLIFCYTRGVVVGKPWL